MTDNICIPTRDFKIYAYLLILILSFNVYVLSTYKKETYQNINDTKTQSIINELNDCKKQSYMYQKDLNIEKSLADLIDNLYLLIYKFNNSEGLFNKLIKDNNNKNKSTVV